MIPPLLFLPILWAGFRDGARTPAVQVEREVPQTAPLNAEFEVRLRLTGEPGTRVRVTDDLGPGIRRLPMGAPSPVLDGRPVPDASGDDGAECELDGQGQGVVGYRVKMASRGDRAFGAVHLRVLSPAGLVRVPSTIPLSQTIRVQPGIEQVRKAGSLFMQRRTRRAGLRRLRRFGDGSEFESLREYVPGDDPRIIDWKASARRDGHLVRNYQAERSQNVVLAIDTGRLMREWIDDRERLDYALAAALVLSQRARDFGDRVGLIAFDDEVRVIQPTAPVRVGRLADLFAGIRSRPVEPNYPLAFSALRRAFRKRSLVVLFSDVIDRSASGPMIGAMRGLSRHHLPLMVALRNPDVEAVAARRVDTLDTLHDRAAAEDLLDSRSRALHSLARGGVQVVDAPPGAGVQATLDRYVAIKERGLL